MDGWMDAWRKNGHLNLVLSCLRDTGIKVQTKDKDRKRESFFFALLFLNWISRNGKREEGINISRVQQVWGVGR